MGLDLKVAFDIFVNNFDIFAHGVMITILFALVGTGVGFLIGLVIGGIRAIDIKETDKPFVIVIKKISHLLSGFYIFTLRGTPMMIQAIFFYYFFRDLFHWSMFVAGLCIISVNTGAYMAEIIRSGIQSIDRGQREAAMSLGMNDFKTLLYIILPQAIKNSFPSIGNQLIVNIKDSSMLNVLTITELFFQTVSIAGSTYQTVETYFISALLYLVLTSLAYLLLNYFEKKMGFKQRPIDMC